MSEGSSAEKNAFCIWSIVSWAFPVKLGTPWIVFTEKSNHGLPDLWTSHLRSRSRPGTVRRHSRQSHSALGCRSWLGRRSWAIKLFWTIWTAARTFESAFVPLSEKANPDPTERNCAHADWKPLSVSLRFCRPVQNEFDSPGHLLVCPAAFS